MFIEITFLVPITRESKEYGLSDPEHTHVLCFGHAFQCWQEAAVWCVRGNKLEYHAQAVLMCGRRA
jgi:hypothetical protein